MRRVVLAVVLLGACYKDPQFGDCALTCTNDLGCPDNLSCLNGMCRLAGHTGSCSSTGMDANMDGHPDGPPNDTDGDGIVNTSDNCPTMFNPLQEDEDSDGIGDICDKCPIGSGAADNDADGDGVGDGCDLNNDGSNPDHIIYFEPFNQPPNANATQVGGGTWTYTNGAAHVVDSGGTTGIIWNASGPTEVMVFTKVTTTATHGTPNMAGTVMRGSSMARGFGCANFGSGTGTEFAIVDGAATPISAQSFAPGSAFNNAQAYRISETSLNGGSSCQRDGGQFQVAGSLGTDVNTGIVVNEQDATFDFVLIVGH